MASTNRKTRDLLAQVMRFGVVGVGATLLHSGIYVLLASREVDPVLANVYAYVPAFVFSFSFQMTWTFRTRFEGFTRPLLVYALKYFLVSMIGLGLNTLGVALITDVLGLDYRYSVLFFFFVTPGALFVLNKFFVFKT